MNTVFDDHRASEVRSSEGNKKVFPEEIEQLITRYPFIKGDDFRGCGGQRGVVINAKFVINRSI